MILPQDKLLRRTFLFDCLRSLGAGALETGPRTFFLLVAIQRFSASDFFKSVIAAPQFMGMILSVLTVSYLSRSRLRKSSLSALSRLGSGACFGVAAFQDDLRSFALWIVCGVLIPGLTLHLNTSIYRENYPDNMRGRLFAWSSMIQLISAVCFHWIIGKYLAMDIGHYNHVLLFYALASTLTASMQFFVPSSASDQSGPRGSFFQAFRWLKRDKVFSYMLFVWFLFGFANLAVIPLKVIYLTDPRYGILLDVAGVALIIGIIPDVVRLFFTPVWAHYFDKYNFIGMRMAINIALLASIVTFFHSRDIRFLALAAVFEGVFNAGGTLAWNLWVTHFAPAKYTGEYMSLHLFFNGVRGVLGAFLGISYASRFGISTVVWFSTGLVLLSIFLMLPVHRFGTRPKPETA